MVIPVFIFLIFASGPLGMLEKRSFQSLATHLEPLFVVLQCK